MAVTKWINTYGEDKTKNPNAESWGTVIGAIDVGENKICINRLTVPGLKNQLREMHGGRRRTARRHSKRRQTRRHK